MAFDGVVAAADGFGEGGVLAFEAAEGVVHLFEDEVGHDAEVASAVVGEVAAGGGEGGDLLGDVDGAVGDAFEVAVDLDDGEDGAEVAGGGLVEGEEINGLFFDFDFLGVDGGFFGEDDVGGGGAAGEEGGGGVLEGGLGHASHAEAAAVQAIE